MGRRARLRWLRPRRVPSRSPAIPTKKVRRAIARESRGLPAIARFAGQPRRFARPRAAPSGARAAATARCGGKMAARPSHEPGRTMPRFPTLLPSQTGFDVAPTMPDGLDRHCRIVCDAAIEAKARFEAAGRQAADDAFGPFSQAFDLPPAVPARPAGRRRRDSRAGRAIRSARATSSPQPVGRSRPAPHACARCSSPGLRTASSRRAGRARGAARRPTFSPTMRRYGFARAIPSASPRMARPEPGDAPPCHGPSR